VIGVPTWWLIKKIINKLNEPLGKKGLLLHFKQYLDDWDYGRTSTGIAMQFEEPYRTGML